MFFTWSFSWSSHGPFSSLEVFSVSSGHEFSHSIEKNETQYGFFNQMTGKKPVKEKDSLVLLILRLCLPTKPEF